MIQSQILNVKTFFSLNQFFFQITFFCCVGGRQFKITVNDTIIINRIDADTGNRIRIEKASLDLVCPASRDLCLPKC